MKELLWTCSSLFLHYNCYFIPLPLFRFVYPSCSLGCVGGKLPPSPATYIYASVSHRVSPTFLLPRVRIFFSPPSFCKRKEKKNPVILSLPSLKPALGHSDHHLPTKTWWCWTQVSVCHWKNLKMGNLLSCRQKARWLSDSSNVCLLQNLYSQAMLQMFEWVYSSDSHQGLFVP